MPIDAQPRVQPDPPGSGFFPGGALVAAGRLTRALAVTCAMVDGIIAYFAADPLKVLYVLGGTGGVWFWLEKYLDRIRLKVRVLGHEFDTTPTGLRVILRFEAVNVGKSSTSLEPFVDAVGYSPKRKRASARFDIDGDRILSPHSTRIFSAVSQTDAGYAWWLFRSFRISPTRGRTRVLYTRTSPRQAISACRYDFELTLFRWLGWLPFVTGTSRDGVDSTSKCNTLVSMI